MPCILAFAVSLALWRTYFSPQVVLMENKTLLNIRPAEPRIKRFINILSSIIFLVIIVAFIWRDESMLHELVSPHIFIALLMVISGMSFNNSNFARLVFHVSCSISWYGVFYLFVTSESDTRFYTKIVRPSWMLAFISFCMALLVRSELSSRSMYLHPTTSSIGIMGLLLYYWGIELNLEHHEILQHHGVMRSLPSKLEELQNLHSNHRLTYSVIIIVMHYSCAFAMHLMHKGPKEDRDKMKIARIRARMKKLGREEADNIPVIAEEDLPDDSIEITREEAFRLTGCPRSDDENSSKKHKVYGA